RCHMLPESTEEQGLADNVRKTLRAGWKRDDVKFPTKFEVVLCHEIDFAHRWLATVHAGLLFSRKNGYTYIEKAGGSGPFVRLDFEDRAVLLGWLGGMFRGAERHGYTHHFATFNDAKIEMLQF